jgi:hypothetical protein
MGGSLAHMIQNRSLFELSHAQVSDRMLIVCLETSLTVIDGREQRCITPGKVDRARHRAIGSLELFRK